MAFRCCQHHYCRPGRTHLPAPHAAEPVLEGGLGGRQVTAGVEGIEGGGQVDAAAQQAQQGIAQRSTVLVMNGIY